MEQSGDSNSEILTIPGIDIQYDPSIKKVIFKGYEAQLTDTQDRILRLFFEDPNKVYKYEEIAQVIWNDPTTPPVRDKKVAVRSRIDELRKRMVPKNKENDCIVTIQNVGYKFKPTPKAIFPRH